MLRVVIDTNVIVSAIIAPKSNPGHIIELVLSHKLQAFYSSKIIEEYEDVLLRPKFGFNHKTVFQFLDYIINSGIFVEPIPSTIPLPDESDRYFYDTAKSSGAYLITGNIRHFPNEISIINPASFLMSL